MSPGSTASFSSFSSLSPPCSAPEQREPLSLVVRPRHQTQDTQVTPKHWKKSISRNYSGENREPLLSPSTSTTAVLSHYERLEVLHNVVLPKQVAHIQKSRKKKTRV